LEHALGIGEGVNGGGAVGVGGDGGAGVGEDVESEGVGEGGGELLGLGGVVFIEDLFDGFIGLRVRGVEVERGEVECVDGGGVGGEFDGEGGGADGVGDLDGGGCVPCFGAIGGVLCGDGARGICEQGSGASIGGDGVGRSVGSYEVYVDGEVEVVVISECDGLGE